MGVRVGPPLIVQNVNSESADLWAIISIKPHECLDPPMHLKWLCRLSAKG